MTRHRVNSLLRRAGLMVMRVAIAGLIFIAGLAVLSSLGLPVPGPAELLDKFKNVSRLAEILS